MIGNLHSLCLWCGGGGLLLWVELEKRKRGGAGCLHFESESFEKETLCEKFGFLVCFINKVVESEDNWFKCVLYSQWEGLLFYWQFENLIGSLGWEERVRFFLLLFFPHPFFLRERERREMIRERKRVNFLLKLSWKLLGMSLLSNVFCFPSSYKEKYKGMKIFNKNVWHSLLTRMFCDWKDLEKEKVGWHSPISLTDKRTNKQPNANESWKSGYQHR